MAQVATQKGKFNVAFEAYFLLAQPDKCIEVLVKAKRIAEATLFAKAYTPSRLAELTKQWEVSLREQGLQYQPEPSIPLDEELVKENFLRNTFYD